MVDAGGGEDVNTQNAIGRTPLHEVAQIGDEKMLKMMWKLNANANILDKSDKSPLHVAAEVLPQWGIPTMSWVRLV